MNGTTTDPSIPPELLTYTASDWNHLPPLGDLERSAPGLRDLRLREHWRRAQDAWANSHGMGRARFEELAKWQAALTPPAALPADPGDTPEAAQ